MARFANRLGIAFAGIGLLGNAVQVQTTFGQNSHFQTGLEYLEQGDWDNFKHEMVNPVESFGVDVYNALDKFTTRIWSLEGFLELLGGVLSGMEEEGKGLGQNNKKFWELYDTMELSEKNPTK